MIGDLFWNVATSAPALGFIGLVLLASLAVGFFPLVRFLPVVGPYVPAARLVALLAAALICFLVGFRVADEREQLQNLRATVAIQSADLENARKSAADEFQRASEIEATANAQHETDAQYIRSLALRPVPACLLDDGDIPGRLRARAAGPPGSSARAAAGSR
jgi:predicted PurR-regulated permease PerM